MNLGCNPFKLRKLARDFATNYSRQINVIVQLKADRAEQEKHIMELEKQVGQLQSALRIANKQVTVAEYFHPIPETRKQRREKRRKHLRQISG